MKLIVDVNLSPDWVKRLNGAGHDAVHWSEIGAPVADDAEIVARADRDGATILTRDLDFGTYVVLAGLTRPSIVQVRAKRASPERYAELVFGALRQTAAALQQGALVTIDFERIRVRLLAYPSSYVRHGRGRLPLNSRLTGGKAWPNPPGSRLTEFKAHRWCASADSNRTPCRH